MKRRADAAERETRTAVIRVQALVRGLVARRKMRAISAAASLMQGCVKGMRATREASCRLTAPVAVRVRPAAAVVFQALWRGVMSREALFRKTIAAVIMQRWVATILSL